MHVRGSMLFLQQGQLSPSEGQTPETHPQILSVY